LDSFPYITHFILKNKQNVLASCLNFTFLVERDKFIVLSFDDSRRTFVVIFVYSQLSSQNKTNKLAKLPQGKADFILIQGI